MKMIFNFSHPLSAEAIEQITQEIGENYIINIPVQLDLTLPLRSQVFDICSAAADKYGQPDYIVPPGLAPAAILIDRYFSRPNDDCGIINTPLIRLVYRQIALQDYWTSRLQIYIDVDQ